MFDASNPEVFSQDAEHGPAPTETRTRQHTPRRSCAAPLRMGIEHVRFDRETFALESLRIILSAFENEDADLCLRAHEFAEKSLGRRASVDFVRSLTSVARKLRLHRQTGFRYLPASTAAMTVDESLFIDGLRAAIDGSVAGVLAAAMILTQNPSCREAADDLQRLGFLVMSARAETAH